MYTRKTYETKSGRLVEEYHSYEGRPPGWKRSPRRRATPEEMKANNLRNKKRQMKLLLMENFSPGDYHTILTYRRDERPEDLAECKRQFGKFIRRMRDWFRKKGEKLKWICNIECGSKGAWHIHLIINRIPGIDMQLSTLWQYGRPRNVLIQDRNGLPALAEYISKGSVDPGGNVIRGMSRSRNLKMPRSRKKKIVRWETWKNDIRIPKGFALDKQSLQEWIGMEGYPHREYILIRLEKRRD